MFKFYGKTQHGKYKNKNDDCFLINSFVSQSEEKQQQLSKNHFVVAIADGVGSSEFGDIASKVLLENISKNSNILSHQIILNIIKNTNRELLKTYKSQASTVFSIVYATDEKIIIYHIGDTRVYKLTTKNNLVQLTNDHTYTQKLIDDGVISENMRFNHPKKNIILQSLGSLEEIHIDIYTNSFETGEKLLLTSDGIHDYIKASEIKDIMLSSKNMQTNINKLIEKAEHNKSKDDISVIIIDNE
jgi:protein phosphatase